MTLTRRDLSTFLAAAVVAPVAARADTVRDPLVIARGAAAGDAPELTAGAYDQAVKDGADFLAAHLVVSKDGVLIARRDNELSASTDIAVHPEFTDRHATKTIAGAERSGWFAEDFTLAELKTLGCVAGDGRRGRAPAPSILTFQEVVDFARAACVRMARVVGVYAFIEDPAYFAGLNLALEPRLAEAVRKNGYDSLAAAMILASPDPAALKTLARLTRARRALRLVGDAAFDPAAVRAVAHAVAPDLTRVIDTSNPRKPLATPLAGQAQASGLAVHAWAAVDASQGLMEAAYAAGADAVLSELARPAARARSHTMSENRET